MAKSHPFKPGDSAPDFSHLGDHDLEPEPDEWAPPAEDPEPTGPPADEKPAPVSPPQSPTPSSKPAPADDGSHVFFDTGERLSEDELQGATTSLTSGDDQPSDADEPAIRQQPAPDTEADSVLDSAPDADTTLEGLPLAESTGLTDVGFPSFDDTPEHAPETVEDLKPADPQRPAGDSSPADEPTLVVAPSAQDRPAATPVTAPGQRPISTSPGSRDRPSTKGPSRDRQGGERPPATAIAAPVHDRRRLALILLASYASAVTIACVWLWLGRSMARTHDLESLPDVAPLDANEFRYVPQNASMPPGHTLPCGMAQQLGNITVEPLRVTRGPVAFVHYADAQQRRAPTEPVLKLWLKFTNVSDNQLIAPLDAVLLLTRNYQVETDTMLANQLVLAADKPSEKPAYVLDHPTTSDWDLVDQRLGYRLKPGESLETYIPIEPGSAAQLSGDLLWRVHFRKGYHEPTGHGVTTMIEVPFALSDVQQESSS